jgi:HAD superfamily hydrolase (TIGR01549 family)
VVFDFDGVVFDTMRYHAEAYRRLFREAADVEVEDREVFLREGQPSQDVIADLARLKGLEWSEERVLELAERKHEIFSKVQEAEPYPGVLELLDDLFERDVLVGLVTGTDPRNVEALLGDRVEGFDAVVTGDDVDEGKPEAEPYIRAIETLGVDPDEVLVVENDLGAADDVRGDVADVLDLLEGDA